MCCVIASLFALGPRAAILIWWLVEPVRWGATFDTFLWPFIGFRPCHGRRSCTSWRSSRDQRLRLRLAGDRRGDGCLQLGRRRVHEPRSTADVSGLTASSAEAGQQRAVGLLIRQPQGIEAHEAIPSVADRLGEIVGTSGGRCRLAVFVRGDVEARRKCSVSCRWNARRYSSSWCRTRTRRPLVLDRVRLAAIARRCRYRRRLTVATPADGIRGR